MFISANQFLVIFNQVFNENRVLVMLSAAGGRAGGRATTVNFWFPLNNFSLLMPIDTKFATNATKITASFFLHCHISILIPVTSILG